MGRGAIWPLPGAALAHGFRAGRSQHRALGAVVVGMQTKRVNWVLDADIKAFFDTVDHAWMMRFLEQRIGDTRVLRLIRKWLTAGVVENGKKTNVCVGTPQGAVITPLLANIYFSWVHPHLWAIPIERLVPTEATDFGEANARQAQGDSTGAAASHPRADPQGWPLAEARGSALRVMTQGRSRMR